MGGFRLVFALAWEPWSTRPNNRLDYHSVYLCTWIPLLFGLWILVRVENPPVKENPKQ